ncbi:MAG: glycoside hydrolase family 9 protein, partial [Bifidobacteriaceae bacterium]|nr:glycoside hydrolase family 9 protein [Bifidobacteriaceae bacterium]
MRKIRAVPILATVALAFAGVVDFSAGGGVAEASPTNANYMMKITSGNGNYDYLSYPGFDVMMYNNGYNGVFGDEHLSGITMILNGQRVAGNGDIHLLPVPEQWDAAAPATSSPITSGASRQYDRTKNIITLPMKYVYKSTAPAEQMNYDLVAVPEPGGVLLKVVLRADLPVQLAGSAAFNLEFIPSLYMNKSYQLDSDGDGKYDDYGVFPLAPEDPMDEEWPRPDLVGNAWYVDQWNTEKGDAQPSPIAQGYQFALAPEDDKTRISVRSEELLSIYDGRNRSQNGWFTMSSKIDPKAKAGDTVAAWHIQAPVQNSWLRATNIAHSQAGYASGLDKVAVMEIDKNDPAASATGSQPGAQATLLRLNANGAYDEVLTAPLGAPRSWARYRYRDFDFSSVVDPGTYVIDYNGVRTDVFPINDSVYDEIWQSGLSGFLTTAMDHIEVREGYKIWHAASHMDDARMGEPFQNSPTTGNITWFDGQSVPTTLPASITARGYSLGSRIPGLNVGGWFDAGDFDLQLSRQTSVLRDLVFNSEAFNEMNGYDTLAVEWDQETGGTAEMHRPDGVPDIVQQVKHGAMHVLAEYVNVGVLQGTVEVPTLRQYTHLGEGSTDTDGFIYDPTLGEDDVVERGGQVYSGKNDDRMLMLGGGAANPAGNLGMVSITLAGAANVTKDDYPEFSRECLAAAKEIFDLYGVPAMTTAGSRSNIFNTLIQLMLATEGTADYATYKGYMDTLLAQAGTASPFASFLPITTNYAAVMIMDQMGPAYKQQVIDAVVATAATYNPAANTPFGFTENLNATWGPISNQLGVGQRAAILYGTIGNVPGIEPIKNRVLDGVNYILGRHPYNDSSWLVGVGAKSHKVPYNSNRADQGFIPGSIVPGYVGFRPDFPESLDNFGFLWAENEAIIDYPSRFMVMGLAASQIAAEASVSRSLPQPREIAGSYQMTGQETVVNNPYTGQPDMPYETLTTPGFDVFMYNTTFSQIFGDQHCAGVELVLNGQRIATNGDIHLLPTPEQWDATPAP